MSRPVEESETFDFRRVFLIACAIGVCWLGVPYASWIGGAVTIYGAYPIISEAVANAWGRRMTMELSMSIALIAALIIGEVLTALIITMFVLIAEWLEKLTMQRGRGAIADLLSLLPQKAFVVVDGAVEERLISQLNIGDVVMVQPGGSVPVDGAVISGHSYVDQSAITGESVPCSKLPGDSVYAGTVNQSGTIDVKTTSIGESTAFGRIIHAIEQAEHTQAPIQKTADRFAGYLVYFALAGAAITFLITHNITSTISVIIVAGACGIAAGTPLAVLGGIGQAARKGAIIKGGLFLESLAIIDTVVFDKTGTVTVGKPTVIDVENVGAASPHEIVRCAAAAESASEHPFGKAIVEHAVEQQVAIERPDQFDYSPGKGVACVLDGDPVVVGNRTWLHDRGYAVDRLPAPTAEVSEVLVGKSGSIIGIVHLADVLRPDAVDAISNLAKLGLRPILLTGDGTNIAQAVARQLAIKDVAAELLPTQKQNYIKQLSDSGARVAMVGDGINDAPALTEALVGIAVGSGTDVAKECADIVLTGTRLSRLVEAIRIARRCKRIIMVNFVGTLVVDTLGILLAAFGYLSPILAAFIHVSSELVFIMNSARLLPKAKSS